MNASRHEGVQAVLVRRAEERGREVWNGMRHQKGWGEKTRKREKAWKATWRQQEKSQSFLLASPFISSSRSPFHSRTLTPAHHPPALYTPPQKSSDSWKVLGVYSVTTKQNHLKTKWASECAGEIWPFSLCGHREKWPLRIKGMESGQEGRHAISIHRLPSYPPT